MKYERLTMINNGFIDTNCKNCKQCKKVGRKYICNDMTACNEEIITRLCELEDKIENGTLIELPCVRKINNALGSYEAVYINERDLIQESMVLTPEQGWLIIKKYACPKHQAEAEKKLKELQGND